MSDPIFDPFDTFGSQARTEQRARAEYRRPVHKPSAVRAQGERANALIRAFAAGEVKSAADVGLSEAELARRNPPSDAKLAGRLASALASDMARNREPRVVHGGVELSLSAAVARGYTPTGNEGKADPERGA